VRPSQNASDFIVSFLISHQADMVRQETGMCKQIHRRTRLPGAGRSTSFPQYTGAGTGTNKKAGSKPAKPVATCLGPRGV
jgi:hypothetical protein